jgi:hypothetical protein
MVNGLAPAQINAGALAITTYVDSAASLEAESEQLEQVTGQSNDAWWNERNELWETYFDVERHPTMTEIWHAGGFGHGTRQAAADSYRFGLDRLLDGIHTLAAQGRPLIQVGSATRHQRQGQAGPTPTSSEIQADEPTRSGLAAGSAPKAGSPGKTSRFVDRCRSMTGRSMSRRGLTPSTPGCNPARVSTTPTRWCLGACW